MEHEVFVPVPAETLRQTLRDPALLARCVPGLVQDADDESAGPLSGRLKVRIGGHTITYRGTLTLTERAGSFIAEGGGTEARGTGSATLRLSVRLTQAPGGTLLTFTGGSQAEGRLAELPDAMTTAAARRLLDRFGDRLAEESAPAEPPAESSGKPSAEPGLPADPDAPANQVQATGAAADPVQDQEPDPGAATRGSAEAARPDSPATGAGDVPPAPPEAGPGPDMPSGDPDADLDFEPDTAPGEEDLRMPSLDGETASGEGDFLIPDEPSDEPPAEAAHARRTMIGRSAEEVDHAPPRGRYAPVPAPDTAGAGATLRWVAPAAALAIASAVVVGRALRRRR
jgi:carbon monoxide dehydrogenase subunit G